MAGNLIITPFSFSLARGVPCRTLHLLPLSSPLPPPPIRHPPPASSPRRPGAGCSGRANTYAPSAPRSRGNKARTKAGDAEMRAVPAKRGRGAAGPCPCRQACPTYPDAWHAAPSPTAPGGCPHHAAAARGQDADTQDPRRRPAAKKKTPAGMKPRMAGAAARGGGGGRSVGQLPQKAVCGTAIRRMRAGGGQGRMRPPARGRPTARRRKTARPGFWPRRPSRPRAPRRSLSQCASPRD